MDCARAKARPQPTGGGGEGHVKGRAIRGANPLVVSSYPKVTKAHSKVWCWSIGYLSSLPFVTGVNPYAGYPVDEPWHSHPHLHVIPHRSSPTLSRSTVPAPIVGPTEPLHEQWRQHITGTGSFRNEDGFFRGWILRVRDCFRTILGRNQKDTTNHGTGGKPYRSVGG